VWFPGKTRIKINADGATTKKKNTYLLDLLLVALRTNEVMSGLYASSTVGCSAASTCTASMAVELAAGGYNWKVQAENQYGHASDWSQPATFAVIISPPSSITLGTSTGNPPTFNWGAVVNAAEYNLKVASTLGITTSVASQAAQICSSATCTATLSSTLSVGLYTWYVTALNSGGSMTSDTATFTIGTATTGVNPTGNLGAAETVAVLEHAEYSYNGDGQMVKSVVNGVITYYAGGFHPANRSICFG
jgi:hypothetical protein